MTTAQREFSTMPGRLHVAFELGLKEWKLALASGLDQPVQRRTITAGDVAHVHQLIAVMKERFHLRADAPVVTCYEAGRDGFWLHRCLTEAGLENVIVDPASIQVSRRAKRVKTDRIDAAALVRLLMRYHQGERKVWSVVEVPTINQEASRHLHREELNLQAEQTQLVNELRGHLFAVGIRLPHLKHLEEQLPLLTQWNGQPLAKELLARLQRLVIRLALVERQKHDVYNARHRLIRQESTPEVKEVRTLLSFKGIGVRGSWLLIKEGLVWRKFRNRRQVASFAGLTPTPYQSGESHHEQGISKAGNKRIRWMLVELAWCWLRYQPQSELSQWYARRFGSGSPRQRKIGIVALARKLLVQLWKCLARGEWPPGAEAVPWQQKLGDRIKGEVHIVAA